jgi:hypothetical protein
MFDSVQSIPVLLCIAAVAAAAAMAFSRWRPPRRAAIVGGFESDGMGGRRALSMAAAVDALSNERLSTDATPRATRAIRGELMGLCDYLCVCVCVCVIV